MTRKEIASRYFADGFACTPAVFTPFGKEMGLTEDQCLKLGCAFGGGIARNQYTCGAVSGALMVLGLRFGRGSEDGIEKKDLTYAKTNEFLQEFTSKHRSIVCKDLLQGLNMNDPVEKKKIEELKLFQTVCVDYIKDAVAIVEHLISE